MGDGNISCVIKRSKKAKKLRLAVHADGRVVLTSPERVSSGALDDFLQNKKSWILSKLELFRKAKETSVLKFGKGDYSKHKNEALKLILSRIDFFNNICKVRINKISVRNQKTRWGSCSRRGNLSFNYKIVFLPPMLRDYVIAHEVCHLKQFNHSKDFWRLVADCLPDYMEARKELRGKYLLI
ncbi:TPA: hypothetical protein DEW47_00820 [Patescibacteria group bacterium]|nr:MAG: hypothetical protein UT71_C0011G0013 [Parcubacteria group bacterium GW2011_GWF2_40_10]KKR46553.1 MAG: hypothetical protein UT83_C0021G0013 [Parcubacteria group bacterium GW2011_GWA2_40_143]KKR59085.1 MAG: hypothetical protein UT97_C0017G0013 [Parcubacteria group bacterium GW2011_GWC2_40_31]KKR75374.1 MAG: hypothetical protein UU18_C0007G0013 [Parcubacteria group bacterium GW2011_GWB2_40_8]KKR77631.1 MAG: hypothetical protein UU20_C0003G0006 [Parcubacteria group bacterium GW2011_GWE2_40_